MKKFFLFALAAAFALTSCTKDETIATTQPGAIAFAPAVDNATRAYVDPSFNTNNLENFNVYGYVSDGTTMGLVFSESGEKVTKASGLWSYQNTQYWTKNMYYFSAIAPAENQNWQLTNATDEAKKLGAGVVTFTNDGTQDLLYWFGTADGNDSTVQENPVHIAFDHLLSKVKFTFENVFDNDQVSLVVKEVKITNAETSAFINLAVADKGWKDAWNFNNGTGIFSFGNAAEASEAAEEHIVKNATLSSNKEMLLFPIANKEFKISFIVDIYMGGLKASSSTHEVSVKTTLEMGKAYNFKAVLSGESEQLNPITFDVEVNKWVEPTIDVNLNKAVRSADELLAAVADKTISEIVLADNINLETQALVINRELTINLNDKTITGGLFAESNGVMNVGNTDSYVFWVQEGGKLTINGAGNVKTQSCKYSIAVWAHNGGEVIINGGYYENAGEGSDLIYAKNGGKLTINGGTFKACEKQDGVDGTNEKYSAINLKDKKESEGIAESTAVVTGGKFYMFDPSDNESENPQKNFVAEGYKVVPNGDWYEVVAK